LPAVFADFFAPVDCDFWSSARFSAQRLLVASLIAFLPAALIFLLVGFGAAAADVDSLSPRILAHLAF
jgi:hypothetical protein